MFNYLLAIIVVSSPIEVPVEYNPGLQKALIHIAVKSDVIDEIWSETYFRPDRLADDICLLRMRIRNVLDAPPLNDAKNFPTREIASERHCFGLKFRDTIIQRLKLIGPHGYNYNELTEVKKECDFLIAIWWNVFEVNYTNDSYLKRMALKELRDKIGHNNYYKFCLPPSVPLWRFND